MRKILAFFIGFSLLIPIHSVMAEEDDCTESGCVKVVEEYVLELIELGLKPDAASTKAKSEVNALISAMKAAKSDAEYNLDLLKDRVQSVPRNDPRGKDADKKFDRAEDKVEDFTDLKPHEHLQYLSSLGGVPPSVVPNNAFDFAEEEAQSAMNDVNRILIGPTRPGAVPEGDIIEDFIPQIVRQLFRFAWLAILIAFVVSGVLMITSFDNEEKLTKAKEILYFTFMGFAFVALAFAIVKGVTDIDFFRFV